MNQTSINFQSPGKSTGQITAMVLGAVAVLCLLGTLIAGFFPVRTYETSLKSFGEPVECGSAFKKNEAGLTSYGSYSCDREGINRNRVIAFGLLGLTVVLLVVSLVLWFTTASQHQPGAFTSTASSPAVSSTPTASALSPPSWNPDPSGKHELRWWDGSQWTSQVMTNGIPSTDTP